MAADLTGVVYIIHGRGRGAGLRCVVVNTWRGHGPHNVAVVLPDGSRMCVPMRRLRKVR